MPTLGKAVRPRVPKAAPPPTQRLGPLPTPTGRPNMFVPTVQHVSPSPKSTVVVTKRPPLSAIPVAGSTGGGTGGKGTTLTLAQQAAALAAAGLDPQEKAINDQIAAYQRDRQAQQLAAVAVENALAQFTSGMPDLVKRAYMDAANAQSGYTAGITGQAGQEASAAAAAAAAEVSRMGAPGSVQSSMPDALNVLTYLGGTMPASSLAGEAANRYTEALGLRSAGGAVVAQQALQQMGATDDQIKQLRQKGIDLESTRPSEIEKALAALQDQQLKEQDLQLRIAMNKAKLTQLQQTKINSTLSAGLGVLVDDYGHTITGKDGKPIPYTPYTKPGAAKVFGSGTTGYFTLGADGQPVRLTQPGAPRPFGSASGGYYLPDGKGGYVKVIPGTGGGTGTTHYQVKTINGRTYLFNPITGDLTDPSSGLPGDPNAPGGPAPGKPLTSKQQSTITRWGRQALNGYYGRVGTGGPNKLPTAITMKDLQALAQNHDKNMTVKEYLSRPDLLKQDNVMAVHLADSPNQDPLVNKLFLSLLATTGADRRRTFDALGTLYPGWKARNERSFFPKADAAQGAAIQGATAKDAAVVGLVQQYLGTPYVWGGTTPKGFDCSGLLQYVWARNGVPIPRTTYDQWKAGTAVPVGQLRPGDAVFFRGSDARGGLPGHVGMYIGGGRFIEAPHSGATVRISTLGGRSDYVGARRYG